MTYSNCPHCGDISQITEHKGEILVRCIAKTCEGHKPWRTSAEWEAHRVQIMPKVEDDTAKRFRLPAPGKPHIMLIDGKWLVVRVASYRSVEYVKAWHFAQTLNMKRRKGS